MRRPELALGLVGVDAIAIEIGARPRAAARAAARRRACSIASAKCAARWRPISASCCPACACATISRAIRERYGIRVRDRSVGTGRLDLDRLLAVADEAVLAHFDARVEREPVYGLPAAWIDRRRPRARRQCRRARLRSDLGARVAPGGDRAHARCRTRRAPRAARRCSNICAPRCRRWSRKSAAMRCRSARSTARSDCSCAKARGRAIRLRYSRRCWKRGPRDPQELAEAARRAIVPDLLRRRGVALLEPVIFDAPIRAAARGCVVPARRAKVSIRRRRFALRARIESYAATIPRDRAAVVCTSALRPVLADFLLRSEIRVNVYAYGELPNEIALAPAEVIAQEEPNALACT